MNAALPSPAVPEPPERPRTPPAWQYEKLIASVRHKLARQLRLQGVLYGLAVAVPLVALAGFAGNWAAGVGRALLILAPVLFLSAFAYFGIYRASQQAGDELRTARLVGRKFPEISSDLLAAVELKRALAARPSFSVDLAHAFLHQTDARAQRLDPDRARDPRRIRVAAATLFGACLVSGVGVLAWSKAWFGGMATLTHPKARGAAPAVQREPITGEVQLTYRYPAYTGLQPRIVPGSNGEVSALAGTEVQIQARADRDLSRAEMVLDGTRIPLQLASGRELSGSFVVQKPGSYRFVFFKPPSRQIAEGPEIPVRVEPDDPPKVSLLSPAEEIEIDPGQKVTLKYSVSDDFGLTSLELVYRAPRDSEDRRLPLRLDDERTFRGEYRWDLGNLKLAPGDRVAYSLAARDNDEVSGKKLGVSRTQYLKIYSAAEHRRDATARAEAIWERLVSFLSDRLEGPDRQPGKVPERVADQQAVDRAGSDLISDMLGVAQELSRQRDSPEELWSAMINIGERLQRKILSTASLRRYYLRLMQSPNSVQDAVRRLAKAVEEEISEEERDVLYLESLLDRQKLLELKELAKQMEGDRRELASLIEQYKSNQDSRIRESIMKQVQALKSRIDELMRRMAELAKGIRDEHLNAEALQGMMKERDLHAQLDEVERLLREEKTDEALAKLQQMAMELDDMFQRLDDSDNQLGGEENPELSAKFQQFMEQLQQTTQQQKQLAEETKGIRDRYRAQMKERLAQKGRSLRERLMQEAEQVAKDYQQLSPEDLGYRADRPLEEAQAELENLRNALKIEDFDLAAESAARAEKAATELSAYAEQKKLLDTYQSPPDVRAQSQQVAERTAKDAQKVREIGQKLQELFPPPDSMLSEADRSKLKQFSEEQRQLEQKARGLQQKMEEISQLAPIFGDDASDQMERVAERMGEASRRIEARDPARGYGEQKAALEQLQRFRQQMRENSGKGRRGGLPLPMLAGSRRGAWGSNRSQEPVQIPGPEQAPNEFRKDLLDAMKQTPPEKYKDQVKRYYEELVK